MLATWKELAWQDGSAGWIGIANFPSAAFAAAYLPADGFDEVFTANDHRVTVAGQFFPNGIGEATDGGFRVTGSWQFGSGVGHSEYVACGFMPADGGVVRMADETLPEMRVAIVPRAEVEFLDGWHVQGLKGTGSYDYALADVFVPEARTYALFETAPLRGSRLYTMGLMPIVGAGHAAWALGVARSALDDAVEIARAKQRMGEMSSLIDKTTFQRDYAHHEAMWRAADRLVTEEYTGGAERVLAGGELTLADRADQRIAATYATNAAREIVEWAHLACGTTAIREGSRLERAFRDIYTGTQHAFVSEKVYIDAAQVMLGLADKMPSL